MSGVRTGSRLEQLEALRARLDHEIAQERRRLATTPRPAPTRAPRPSEPRTPAGILHATLTDLGATPHDVRTWAREQGVRIAERGPVPRVAIEAYIDTHRPKDQT